MGKRTSPAKRGPMTRQTEPAREEIVARVPIHVRAAFAELATLDGSAPAIQTAWNAYLAALARYAEVLTPE